MHPMEKNHVATPLTVSTFMCSSENNLKFAKVSTSFYFLRAHHLLCREKETEGRIKRARQCVLVLFNFIRGLIFISSLLY